MFNARGLRFESAIKNNYTKYEIERRPSGLGVPHEIARHGQLQVTAFSANDGLRRLSPSYGP